jgi:3-hydroxybutyryl-CoA dehydratase
MSAQTGICIEDLSIGQSASYTKTVTEADIVKFADVSAGFISTVIGTKLPGNGTIYMSQTLRFKAPVRIGDTVTATCTVSEIIPDKRRAVLTTVCKVDGNTVIEGEALVMVPSRGK